MSARMNDQVKETIGEVMITIDEKLNLKISVSGVMQEAHMLSMASDYLKKYKDKVWEGVWQIPQDTA